MATVCSHHPLRMLSLPPLSTSPPPIIPFTRTQILTSRQWQRKCRGRHSIRLQLARCISKQRTCSNQRLFSASWLGRCAYIWYRLSPTIAAGTPALQGQPHVTARTNQARARFSAGKKHPPPLHPPHDNTHNTRTHTTHTTHKRKREERNQGKKKKSQRERKKEGDATRPSELQPSTVSAR